MSGLLPQTPSSLSPYLYIPSLPSQPQEGPGSPKHWYYLCAPHLRPPLCRNLAHPTKGNRWCTTVHGMTSVSVGRQLMVNDVAGARHVPWWRMLWRINESTTGGCITPFSVRKMCCLVVQCTLIKACKGHLRTHWCCSNVQRHIFYIFWYQIRIISQNFKTSVIGGYKTCFIQAQAIICLFQEIIWQRIALTVHCYHKTNITRMRII